jgi:arginyl-tRNA synthetase
MIRQKLAALVSQALIVARTAGTLCSETFPDVLSAPLPNEAHGDFACNIAMQLAKPERKGAPPGS